MVSPSICFFLDLEVLGVGLATATYLWCQKTGRFHRGVLGSGVMSVGFKIWRIKGHYLQGRDCPPPCNELGPFGYVDLSMTMQYSM